MLDKNAESCYVCHAADQPITRLAIEDRTRIYTSSDNTSRLMGVINPIQNEVSCYESDCHAHSQESTILGVLDVTIHLDEVDKQLEANTIREIIFAVVSISAIGILIGFFVAQWINKPVKELVKATDQIALGNFNYTIENLGKDELGKLAKSFNNMTKKLEEMRQQIFQSDKKSSKVVNDDGSDDGNGW